MYDWDNIPEYHGFLQGILAWLILAVIIFLQWWDHKDVKEIERNLSEEGQENLEQNIDS